AVVLAVARAAALGTLLLHVLPVLQELVLGELPVLDALLLGILHHELLAPGHLVDDEEALALTHAVEDHARVKFLAAHLPTRTAAGGTAAVLAAEPAPPLPLLGEPLRRRLQQQGERGEGDDREGENKPCPGGHGSGPPLRSALVGAGTAIQKGAGLVSSILTP